MKLLPLGLMLIGALLIQAVPAPAAVAQTEPERVTIIVLDQSGSMSGKDLEEPGTDPGGLRCSAARLLADLGTAHDFLGLVRLESHDRDADQTAKVLTSAGPVSVGTAKGRSEFKALIECDTAYGNTPIADALQKAFEQLSLAESARSGQPFEGRVLLLTDGVPKPKPNDQIMQIRGLLPVFAGKRWKISTIGLKLDVLDPKEERDATSLLQQIANETGGSFYGNVTEPLNLQEIFVTFYAQQTGRTLISKPVDLLDPDGEERIEVPSYASRIDVLVAKDMPAATIQLYHDDQLIDLQNPKVQLSSSDKYYALFSIERPPSGRWTVRTSAKTKLVINTLVSSELRLVLDQDERARPSNQPLVIRAHFASTAGGAEKPVALSAVQRVEADLSTPGGTYPIKLLDDGQQPDTAAGDGVYAGQIALGADQASIRRISANITLRAIYQGQEYKAEKTLQLVALPQVVLGGSGDKFAFVPGEEVQIPLALRLGGQPVPADGWRLEVTQHLPDGSRPEVQVSPDAAEEGRFVARLQALSEDEQDYDLSVTLVGTGSNEGLRQEQISLRPRVAFRPTVRMTYDGPLHIPVNHSVVIEGALLNRKQSARPLDTPLRLTTQLNGGVRVPVESRGGDGSGTFRYQVASDKPGVLTLVLEPPSNELSVQEDRRTLVIDPVPELRWQDFQSTPPTRAITLRRWPMLDLLRGLPVLGWLPARLPYFQSEQALLKGQALMANQPYSRTFSLRLTGADGKLLEQTQDRPDVELPIALAAGQYRLDAVFGDLFDPQIGCCVSSAQLQITNDIPWYDIWLAAGIALAEVLGFGWLLLVARFQLSPHPVNGDRFFYNIQGRDVAFDLRAEQRGGLLQPSKVDLSRRWRQYSVKQAGLPERAVVIYQPGGGITFNGRAVPGEQRGAAGVMRYEPSRQRQSPRQTRAPRPPGPGGRPPRGPRPPGPGGRPRSTAQAGSWLKERFGGWFGAGPSRRKSPTSTRSRTHTRRS